MQKILASFSVLACAQLLAAWSVEAEPAGRSRGYESTIEESPDLRTAVFDTPEGRISVHLPDDARPGDTISGTVSMEPAGRDERERSRNRGRLQGYVVEVADERTSPGEPPWTAELPPGADGGIGVALVSGRRERERARVELPPPPAEPARTSSGMELPELGQTGRAVAVHGPFDGSLGSSRLTIGGTEVEPLAESPRKAVFRSPVDVVGPVEIRLEEGGRTASGTYRNVAIDLSAPRLDLQRGEQTTLTVRLTGLEGLDRPVAFRVVNSSPAVVRLEGGDEQTVTVAPERVDAGGSYVWQRPLIGIAPGAFDLQAHLELPDRVADPRGGGPEIALVPPGHVPPVQVCEHECKSRGYRLLVYRVGPEGSHDHFISVRREPLVEYMRGEDVVRLYGSVQSRPWEGLTIEKVHDDAEVLDGICDSEGFYLTGSVYRVSRRNTAPGGEPENVDVMLPDLCLRDFPNLVQLYNQMAEETEPLPICPDVPCRKRVGPGTSGEDPTGPPGCGLPAQYESWSDVPEELIKEICPRDLLDERPSDTSPH